MSVKGYQSTLTADKIYQRSQAPSSIAFGLGSAPKLFSVVGDSLQWIVEHNGVQELLHYLDDFLILGARFPRVPTGFGEGSTVVREVGSGAATSITFLGMGIHSLEG